MRAAAATAIVLLLGGCALRARDHPCWPFLAHLYHDRVPKDVVRALARDRDARRTVRGARAPTGAYWRRRRPPGDAAEVHTLIDGWELVPCPGVRVAAPRP
ncbi:MAG TPA: hypothetical protein VFD84_14990 [Candidatus Binatia bacterium]|nr:hypothetical protein [Candidatus Binatia bacterium]